VLSDLRKDYTISGLHENDLDPDPFAQFHAWFEQAREAIGHEPNAMTVATASKSGRPAARMVLLKGLDHGFIFYGNYQSAKGADLAENPEAELLFYWPELERQVRVHGKVERLDRAASELYFYSRPAGNQLGAIASRQSQVIASREALEAEFARLEAEYAEREIPMPEHWGGYRVIPETIEFWQGRRSRLHDRLRYRRSGEDAWAVERLSP
jgi:pyridoxamine 5'-phosphate oxidase